mgnify:FL=1
MTGKELEVVNMQLINIANQNRYEKIKRFFDICLSAAALVVLSPLLLVIAILIYLEDKGPVIYSQTRIGKDGRAFKLYKFRSMCVDADEKLKDLQKLNERDGPVFKIKNDPRVTKVGKFIRKTCIDELPQLVNIIKGDMSIVGPRPPLPNEVEQYNSYQKQRLLVVPGLTCYWQIQKGEETPFDEWVELDLKYIKERSILLDFRLILLTFKVILSGKGAE